jgi:hypothetical protein
MSLGEKKGGKYMSRGLAFFYRKGKKNLQLGTGFITHHRIVSAVC